MGAAGVCLAQVCPELLDAHLQLHPDLHLLNWGWELNACAFNTANDQYAWHSTALRGLHRLCIPTAFVPPILLHTASWCKVHPFHWLQSLLSMQES